MTSGEIGSTTVEKRNSPKLFKSPISVLWNITKKCELSCLHCYSDSCSEAGANDLTDEEAMRVAASLIECDVVDIFISGGEPLCRRNILEKALPLFAENKAIIRMVTSGYGLTQKDVELFERCRTHVVVSLDGASAEVHDSIRGRAGAFDQAISALKLLSGRIPSLSIMFVLTNRNVDELGKVIDLAASIGNINLVEAHAMVERGRGRQNSQLQITLDDRQKAIEVIGNKMEQYNKKPYCILNDPTLSMRRIIRSNIQNTGAFIDNNGDVRVIPWLPIKFGNLKRNSLIEIWEQGLNDCWRSSKMDKYLKGMRNINHLGAMAESNNYEIVDFNSL